MNVTRVDLLADEITKLFTGTEAGHCARVDFLEREESIAVRDRLIERATGPTFLARLLSRGDEQSDRLCITTDEAIEIRNRKEDRLCLFVPTDLVDAAVSSLVNSFAPIDGRLLHAAALDHLLRVLSNDARRIVHAVFGQVKTTLRVSDDQRLDFATAILELDGSSRLDESGLDLWKAGLIPDAQRDFVARLSQNRRAVLALSRPPKLLASTSERLQSVGVDATTAAALARFFRGRALHDAREWARALAITGPTFDRWTFPEEDPSDIRSVTIRPFINAESEVEKYCGLQQPDGARGSLLALVGKKGKLVVRWISDPQHPNNLSRWRVEIVPSGTEAIDTDIDLPSREVPGNQRTVTLSLDMDLEEAPDFGVVVRVTGLDGAANPIMSGDSEVLIVAESDEFFLVTEIEDTQGSTSRDHRSTVPTLALGRLEAAIEMRDNTLTETQAQWLSKDQEYFSLRLNERRVLSVGLTGTLLDLERRVIGHPQASGCYLLDVDEVRPVEADDCVPCTLAIVDRAEWGGFVRARETFFGRLKRTASRDVIEIADWGPELAGAALRYAQSYRDMLDALLASGADATLLREALSVDTLLLRVQTGEMPEEALVVLPTHPLRVAWLAGYTQLLRGWETRVLEREPRSRKGAIDVQAARLLAPTNVPAFAFHTFSQEAFVFFQNLRFYHGVALPAWVPDPHRRYADVALMVGADAGKATVGDLQPKRVAEHVARFHDLHPYVSGLVVTLINPDQGDFVADALTEVLNLQAQISADPDLESLGGAAGGPIQITAFVEDPLKSSLQALDRVRQAQSEIPGRRVDVFLPQLATIVRSISVLDDMSPPDAHVTVVTDFTRPHVTTADLEPGGNMVGSISLHGLVTRFVPQLTVDGTRLRWRHYILAAGVGRPEQHPAGARFGDTLVDLQESMLNAGSRLIGGIASRQLVLEVTLAEERWHLLARLHQHSNWVITLDRFFAMEFYDSPSVPQLQNVADTYVIDYSPEFAEGLGHRLMVTTTWRDEIGVLLARAMHDLGFVAVDQSVRQLLHHLKTISGRLALQALRSDTTAAAVVGLGAVAALLESRGRLRQAVLLPVDLHPRLFSRHGYGALGTGERRCDLVLVSLKRNIVEATFVEVKWRRGNVSLDELGNDMLAQMEASAEAMRERFFDSERIDGSLQRAYLANVLRFYFERAQRYGLFDLGAETSFLDHLSRLEKTGLQFRPYYEGFIVSLEQQPRRPFQVGEAKISVLTAADFEGETQLSTIFESTAVSGDGDNPASETTDQSVDVDIIGQADWEDPKQLKDGSSIKTEADESPLNETRDLPEPAAESSVVTSETRVDGHGSRVPDGSLHIALGEGADGEVAWTPSTKGSPHLFIIGIPGQGKSWTVSRILGELGMQEVPALVLDFHGQFADTDSPFVQKAAPVILDAASGLPFSPFECNQDPGSGDWKVNTFAIAEIFAYVAGLGDMQRDVVYTAIKDAYLAHGFGDSTSTRNRYPTLDEVLAGIEMQERARRVSNVSARCRPLLEMDLFRPGSVDVDLLSLIRGGLVIDLHNLYVETLQLAAGAFVLRKVYKDMFHWGTTDRLRLAIVLDEAHRLARDITLPKIMKEGRKYGVAVIVASQGMSDFHQDVLGNAGTKVIFRTNYPESRKIAGFIRARQGQDLASRIEQLPVGSAYIQTPEMPFGAVVEMYPLAPTTH